MPWNSKARPWAAPLPALVHSSQPAWACYHRGKGVRLCGCPEQKYIAHLSSFRWASNVLFSSTFIFRSDLSCSYGLAKSNEGGGCSRAALGSTARYMHVKLTQLFKRQDSESNLQSLNHAFFNEFIFRKLPYTLSSNNVCLWLVSIKPDNWGVYKFITWTEVRKFCLSFSRADSRPAWPEMWACFEFTVISEFICSLKPCSAPASSLLHSHPSLGLVCILSWLVSALPKACMDPLLTLLERNAPGFASLLEIQMDVMEWFWSWG